MIVVRNKVNHNILINGVTIKSGETYSWDEIGLEVKTRKAIQNAQNVGLIDVFIYPDENFEHSHNHQYQNTISDEELFKQAIQENLIEETKSTKRKTKKEE